MTLSSNALEQMVCTQLNCPTCFDMDAVVSQMLEEQKTRDYIADRLASFCHFYLDDLFFSWAFNPSIATSRSMSFTLMLSISCSHTLLKSVTAPTTCANAAFRAADWVTAANEAASGISSSLLLLMLPLPPVFAVAETVVLLLLACFEGVLCAAALIRRTARIRLALDAARGNGWVAVKMGGVSTGEGGRTPLLLANMVLTEGSLRYGVMGPPVSVELWLLARLRG